MFKNVASQSIELFAFDTTTGAAKTGDSANMVFYVTKDFGTVTAIAASSGVPTEMDATNAKGLYKIALSQAETNADYLTFSGKSSTSNISVVAKGIDTYPANFSTLSVDGSGRVDVIKVAGTSQTARDLGASVLLSTGTGTGQLDFTSGVVKGNVTQWLGTAASTPTVAGIPNVNAKTWNDLTTVALPLIPTTAGRTLDVSASGEAGLDWANVGSPTTTLNLSGTTVGVAAALTANNDKTGYALTSGERNSIADAMLDRDMSTGVDNGSPSVRTVRQALRFLRNKWAIATGTLTVYKEDDSTSSWTSTVTTTAGADPVTTNDPA